MNARIGVVLFIVLAIIAVVALRVVMGGDEPEAVAPVEPAPIYEVYVDASESAADRLDGPITDAVTSVISTAADEDAAITIHPLSGSSASADEITDADFGDPPDAKEEGFLLRGWRNSERNRLEEDFAEWAATTTPADQTDLLGALVNAAGPAGSSGDREVVVVLISDGLNYTQQWRWADGPLDGPGCKDLAERITLPDLAGADVLFLTGGHDVIAPTQSLDVEACWKEIIQAAGGETPAGWFDR